MKEEHPGTAPEGASAVLGPGSPEDGHQFHFEVRVQGSYGITGDPKHYDAPLFPGPGFRLTVRAWSLQEACAKAAQVPLPGWHMPGEEVPTEPAPDLHRGPDAASDVAPNTEDR